MQTWRPRAVALLVWVALPAILPGVGRSEEPDDSRQRAVQLTSEGAAAYKAKDYAKAADRFSDAYRLYPTPPLLLNMSRADLKLSRCREALHYAEMFKAAVSDSTSASTDAPDEWLARVQRSCIEAQVDSIPPGATIWIDGERQSSPGSTPWNGRLPVGMHKVLVWHPGYQEQKALLKVSANAPANLNLNLVPVSTSGESPPSVATSTPASEPSPKVPPPEASRQAAALPPKASAPVEDLSLDMPAVAAPVRPPTSSAPPARAVPRPSEVPSSTAAASVTLMPTAPPTTVVHTELPITAPPPRRNTHALPAALGWAGVGVGAVALAVGFGLGVAGYQHQQAVHTTLQPDARSVLDTGNSEVLGADALFGIGGAFAAIGTGFVVAFQ